MLLHHVVLIFVLPPCLQYVMHFPKGEKYVSLLRDAPADAPEAQLHLQAERQRLMRLVKQQVAESAAVTEADEGIKAGQVRVKASEWDR